MSGSRAEARCFQHPDAETLLSCGVCERPICVSCARHTSVGTRCWECAGEPPPAGAGLTMGGPAPAAAAGGHGSAAAALEAQAPGAVHWLAALGVGVFSFLIPPLLIIGLWQAWRKKLTHRLQLTIGIASWGLVWGLSQLLIVRVVPGEVFPEYSLSGAAALLILSVILIPLLLGPAISCSHQLHKRDGLWASLPVFSGVCAALMLTIAFSLTVFMSAL